MAVAAYAKTKGEYESRLQQIRELYKGKEGYTGEEGANTRFQAELNAEAKFEKELIADLVGDYLFTDKQFVEKLFNEDRGLFNWIRKQINYIHSLCKAGSKEARQLEKAKKMFTEVFREGTQEGVKNPTEEGGVKYSLGDVNYPRKTIDYKDTNARRIAEDETVNALISRGKVTTITKDSIPAEISNVNWGDKGESRKAIKEILKDFLGEDVVFNLGEDSAIAYLTSKGIDHTLAGENTEEKAVALSAFYKLISNAEYSYSGLQDQHSKTVGREEWDYFVSVAEIEGGATVPLVFAVRSIDQDVRSQIYSIATKKNLAIPRGDGTQGNPANAHPSYGDSSSSNDIVEHNDKNVNNKNSTSTPGTTSLSAPGQVETAGGGWDVRGQDVGLPMPEETAAETDQEDIEISMSEDVVIDELLQLQEDIYQLDQLEIKKEDLERKLKATQDLRDHLSEKLEQAKKKYAKHKNKISGSARKLLKRITRLSMLSQNPAIINNQIQDIQNQIETLEEEISAFDAEIGEGAPKTQGYQQSSVAVGANEQAKPVNLPGLDKSQPQSQGKAKKVGLPGLEWGRQSQQASQTEDGVSPEDAAMAEQRRLDQEFRQQAGLTEDPSLYDPDEGEGVETTRDKLEVQKRNQQWAMIA